MQLIYYVMLASGVQHNIHICIYAMYVYICVYNTYMLCINILTESFPFFRFFSLIGYYKILSIVPYVIQEVLIDYLFYIQ